MKWQRCMTSTPGLSFSTMKAVVAFGFSGVGVLASTTNRPARVPLVHQSFSPLMMKCSPSGAGRAVVVMRAGSLPTSVSVSAKAEISPWAQRGRNICFCSSVPKTIRGCGTPMDWCAEIRAVRLPQVPPSSMAARE